MPKLILTNVRPWGREPVDLIIADGVIEQVVAASTAPSREDAPEAERVDGGGMLALPGFVNTHAHVDKSWWGQPWVSYGGEPTTQGRIAHERAERDKYGIPSVDSTVAVLREFLRHGTTAVRTHVDVDLGVGLRGIEVTRQAAAALGDAIEIEFVAFPQDGVIRRPGVLGLLDRAAAEGAANIGGLDPASIDRNPVAQLDGLFDIAGRHGVGIDVHLHDGGSLGLFQYELIIDLVRRTGLRGKINISHGFALGDVPDGQRDALLDGLQEAGMSWTTVAPVGSRPLPWRQLRERGIPVGLGTDGIRDLWSPYGDGDILRVAQNFARLHGIRTDEEIAYAVELATSRAAGFVHQDQHDLVAGARGDVVLLDAENVQDALMRTPRRELVVAAGRVVARAGEVLI
ncbi:amidohydrolase family protein [Microlunatus elymi]|uniref:Amidohydrolase family protein n=1 Tax=Microlunatus elymi TaxID=2596828 RepID=A0A516PY74_9ACTN|nr:amidohydrolase [Microlunatus elymi]QDP96120.1 amidohydrolase family protein [Microlunatus elymi]